MDNDTISKLLRLKRYEQPPEDYFENFLAEFQLRQRAEVIHRPFWRIAWDRLCYLLAPQGVPRLVAAGSFAVAVIACGTVMTWSDDETNPFATSATTAANSTPLAAAAQSSKPSKSSSAVQYVLPTEVVTYASRRSF